MRLLPAILTCGLLVTGCGTRHKTYKAPDPAKVQASTRQVKEDVARSHVIARDARTSIDKAQKNAEKITADSASLQAKSETLAAEVPAEFKPQVDALSADIQRLQEEEGVLVTNLAAAQEKNDQLVAQLAETETHVAKLEADQRNYQAQAQTLAQEATAEREYRIKAEKQLFQQKVFGWLFKIVGGLAILGVVVVIFLWWIGKLTFKSAAIAAKLT